MSSRIPFTVDGGAGCCTRDDTSCCSVGIALHTPTLARDSMCCLLLLAKIFAPVPQQLNVPGTKASALSPSVSNTATGAIRKIHADARIWMIEVCIAYGSGDGFQLLCVFFEKSIQQAVYGRWMIIWATFIVHCCVCFSWFIALKVFIDGDSCVQPGDLSGQHAW